MREVRRAPVRVAAVEKVQFRVRVVAVIGAAEPSGR